MARILSRIRVPEFDAEQTAQAALVSIRAIALIPQAFEMNDEWNEKLRCLKCGKTGMASLCQSDGDDLPAVQTIPDGFKVVDTRFGPVFYCGDCNVEVAP